MPQLLAKGVALENRCAAPEPADKRATSTGPIPKISGKVVGVMEEYAELFCVRHNEPIMVSNLGDKFASHLSAYAAGRARVPGHKIVP